MTEIIISLSGQYSVPVDQPHFDLLGLLIYQVWGAKFSPHLINEKSWQINSSIIVLGRGQGEYSEVTVDVRVGANLILPLEV